MKGMGWLLLVVGAVLVVVGLVFDPSVDVSSSTSGLSGYNFPDRVINTGQLAVKAMWFETGLASLVMGTVCLCGARLLDALTLRPPLTAADAVAASVGEGPAVTPTKIQD